ncbi:MAG TPA: beta-galactosidase [Candidatus Dormibacteraeota bacterium]
MAARGECRIGISFRPRQVEAFGLEGRSTLEQLLAYPFDLIRLAAYWDRIEPRDGAFDTAELDWQLEAAERAGKQVILGVGAVKNFGYPEVFVPKHHLDRSLKEGSLVTPESHPALLAAAKGFISRVVGTYASRPSIIAWQLEHEAVDPLGVEHSWRLSEAFVRSELDALRQADQRPVLMNGFLPMSPVVALNQRWSTRDQGDSLAVAARLADIVGVDYYPRHALVRLGPRTLYVDGSRSVIPRVSGKRVMFSEGQAEPWETDTTPPNPSQNFLFSCGPEQLITNFNAAMAARPEAYLFWGAEYWILRKQSGDPSYLQAFERILSEAS